MKFCHGRNDDYYHFYMKIHRCQLKASQLCCCHPMTKSVVLNGYSSNTVWAFAKGADIERTRTFLTELCNTADNRRVIFIISGYD